ncbi:conserved Plasmodium protein, unknown function [Plasmodium vinckei vinckei]|uniref:ATPase AAA-type core domain-containing protein n=1 Tax=Plasmodium vinckei vinckei TaxID=54757 RepID=A0A081IBI8_PLAVN|nr:conserved Plasmodium protein, unknown function [Plasmodium vinckei vinckei]KEG01046.1 hypothetical protein YYE_04079 [Plasmodium vinckei vinckei]VEV55024.1 conserved Plasmodium protein, unknown function [Plasmodium vinckei vinckei]
MEKEKAAINFENLKNVCNIFLYKIKESADLTSQEKCEKREQYDEVRNGYETTKWRNNDVKNEKESENLQKPNDNKIVNSMYGKETTCNKPTDEYKENTILFSYVGKKLFLSNNLNVKKEEIIRNCIVVKKDNNLSMIFNKRKNLYAIVIPPNVKKNPKKNSQKNKYSYIYSVYTYCKIRYNTDLRYLIKINFLKSTFKALQICTINFNEHLLSLLLNYTSLQKDDIKDKLKLFNNSNILYFIIVTILESKNDQALVDTAMSVLKKGKKKSSIFHIIKNKSYSNSLKLFNYKHVSSQNKFYTTYYFSNNDESNLSKQRESIYNEEKIKIKNNILLVRQRNEFFQNILSIFSLLNIENKPLLDFYNLENHTRIFIYNCEKLNRNIFINFLKSFQNFYIHFVNLNTLFGLYFSETERNIVNVFKKCHRVLRCVSKNVCLVIDGIDIIAKNDTKNPKENINSSIIDEANRNCNSRLLATLLLCLDSVDNDTSNKYKTTSQNSFEASSDDSTINPQTNQQNCKKGKKKNIPMHNNQDDPSFSFSEFSDNNDFSDNTEKERERKKKGKKKKKMSEHIYFDIKKLEKIYKEKHQELIKKKKNNNLSVIVISDMDLTNFDTSLTRAGRFFHYINYRSFC